MNKLTAVEIIKPLIEKLFRVKNLQKPEMSDFSLAFRLQVVVMNLLNATSTIKIFDFTHFLVACSSPSRDFQCLEEIKAS